MLQRVGRSLTLLQLCFLGGSLSCSSHDGPGNTGPGTGGSGPSGLAGASAGVPAGGGTSQGGAGQAGQAGASGSGGVGQPRIGSRPLRAERGALMKHLSAWTLSAGLTLSASLPVHAAEGESSFTPTSFVMPIYSHHAARGLTVNVPLYTCEADAARRLPRSGDAGRCRAESRARRGTTTAWSTWRTKPRSTLLFSEPADIPPGTYDSIVVGTCENNSAFEARVKGSVVLEEQTYYTTRPRAFLSTEPADQGYSSITYAGCGMTVQLVASPDRRRSATRSPSARSSRCRTSPGCSATTARASGGCAAAARPAGPASAPGCPCSSAMSARWRPRSTPTTSRRIRTTCWRPGRRSGPAAELRRRTLRGLPAARLFARLRLRRA